MNSVGVNRFYFVLPAYDPDEKMIPLVRELAAQKSPDDRILIIDDGSTPTHRKKIFAPLEELPDVTILHHEVNRGKGAALKTAFRFILDQPDLATIAGCVTADCDGQHPVARMLEAKAIMEKNPDALVLGCRRFSGDLPWKSQLGNQITKWTFRVLLRRPISDTQTGLRGIPAAFMQLYLKIPQNRFEYETQMLLVTPENHFVEFPLETIYFDQNSGTHFRPVKDALRIYGVVFHFFFSRIWLFFLSSLSAYFVDLGLFSLLFYRFLTTPVVCNLPFLGVIDIRLFLCCTGARVVSSIWNFSINRIIVFRKKKAAQLGRDLVRYYLLALCIMLLSWGALEIVTRFWIAERLAWLAKILIDAVLFLFSYTVQRNHIFNQGK